MILKLVNLFIFKGWKLLRLNKVDGIYIDFDNEYNWISDSSLCYRPGAITHSSVALPERKEIRLQTRVSEAALHLLTPTL